MGLVLANVSQRLETASPGKKPSRKTLTDARDMVVRMTHRGAKQAHEDDGDGVGIMISIPDEYYRTCCTFTLPEAGSYGVGNLFMPPQANFVAKSLAPLPNL